ncbi:Uncharacterised protein [uncultured archaeon]|nr:Uncharacterised protein [uncultured archaeon]
MGNLQYQVSRKVSWKDQANARARLNAYLRTVHMDSHAVNTVENMERFAREIRTACDTPECKGHGIYIWRGKHYCTKHKPTIPYTTRYQF